MVDWFRSWHGAPTDPKWRSIARRAKVAVGVVSSVAWALIDHASQAQERGSIEGFDAEGIADFFDWEQDQVEAVLDAMRDKGIIVGSRLAAWDRRQADRERRPEPAGQSTERSRRARERQAAERAAAELGAELRAEPGPAVAAAPDATAMQRHATACNATESESGEEIREESSSSGQVVPFPRTTAAPSRTDDDDLFEKIREDLDGKAEDRVIRAGLPIVRGWIAEGCEFERDIRAELREFAPKLKVPLRNFSARWLERQVMARRDARLAAQKARARADEAAAEPAPVVFVAEGSPAWAAWVAAGHKPGLNRVKGMNGGTMRGWFFPSTRPPARASPAAEEAAPATAAEGAT